MNRLILKICAIAAAAVLLPSPARAANYTFDGRGLVNGNLAGQDGWYVPHSGSPLFETSMDVQTGVSSPSGPTTVAKNPGDGTTDTHRTARTNDLNYSFGNLAGATMVTLQFDTRIIYPNPESPSPANYDNASFFLSDLGDNLISTTPQLQWGNSPTFGPAPIVAVRQANYGAGDPLVALPTNIIASGDWVTLRLVMDFNAAGGSGLGSLSFNDLTQNTGFISIGPPQALGLTPTIKANAAFWNTMFLRSDTNAGNLVIDNLTVDFTTAIPEVKGAWVAAACIFVIGVHFLRRRRQAGRG